MNAPLPFPLAPPCSTIFAAFTVCSAAPLLKMPDWRLDACADARPPVMLIVPLVDMACALSGAVAVKIVDDDPLLSEPTTLMEPDCATRPAVMLWLRAL